MDRSKSSQLCAVCQKFQDTRASFQSKYSTIARSAGVGCDHCIWLEFSLYQQAYADLVVLDKSIQISWELGDIIEIWEYDDAKRKDELIGLELFTPEDSPPVWTGLGQSHGISTDPGHEDALQLVNTWSEHCLAAHPRCQLSELPILPTRVLDVEHAEPRVVESQGAKGRYIALSHCWGSEQGLTATSRNMTMLMTKINVNALMKTFQDAILVARTLGVRYLWIDSLCIIQDSDEDWTYESSKMWNVYRNSFLTIVAAGSHGDAQGFLGPRQYLPTMHTHTDGTRIGVRRCAHSGPPEPLYFRAWTFQERFLSPRMIKFKRQELEWHCRTGKGCECRYYRGDQSERPLARVDSSFKDPNFSHAYHRLIEGPEAEVCSIWRTIVQQYSRLKLTKPSDRLPALSGIATMVHARFPTEHYWAGIWSCDALQGLQWYRELDLENAEPYRPPPPVSPTWSWISVPGPVKYTRGTNDPMSREICAEIGNTDVVLRGPDTYGQCLRGMMKITAPTLQLYVNIRTSRDGTKKMYDFRHGDQQLARKYTFYPDENLQIKDGKLLRSSTLDEGPRHGTKKGTGLVWMVVLEVEKQEVSKDICRCLVLGNRLMTNELYRRLGYMVIEGLSPSILEEAETTTLWLG